MKDLRAYARQSQWRYLAGGLFLLFVVGDGLIYWLYGRGAAWIGFFCLLGGMVPIGLIFGVLALLDKFLQKINQE